MGQATKRGMYCPQCQKPVAGSKTTHGVRNLFAIPTLGATTKVERWHCPDCGGRVEPNRFLYKVAHKMNEEKARARRETAAKPPAKESGSSGTSDKVLAQIKELSELHEAGATTDEEFAAKKTELLSRL